MKTLVDTNVLLDIITQDKKWCPWSEGALRTAAEHSTLAINPIIFAEVSMKFARVEDADAALVDFAREPLPYEAGFLTGKALLAYKRRGGSKRSPAAPIALELRQPAVDRDLAGGHEAAVLRSEKSGHRSDLRRIGHALERGHRGEDLLALLA